jgi:hypothetical protein
MCYCRHIADGVREAPATERHCRAPAALCRENIMSDITRTELQELITYLERCARTVEGAELPQEWARQLLLVRNAKQKGLLVEFQSGLPHQAGGSANE